MKIIKRGKTADDRIWRGECRRCGSEVEAVESELKNIQHDQREGSSFSWEMCPACGAGNPSLGGHGGLLLYPVMK